MCALESSSLLWYVLFLSSPLRVDYWFFHTHFSVWLMYSFAEQSAAADKHNKEPTAFCHLLLCPPLNSLAYGFPASPCLRRDCSVVGRVAVAFRIHLFAYAPCFVCLVVGLHPKGTSALPPHFARTLLLLAQSSYIAFNFLFSVRHSSRTQFLFSLIVVCCLVHSRILIKTKIRTKYALNNYKYIRKKQRLHKII